MGTANIDKICLWEDNPDKTRTSKIVRIDFKFPCTWTTLTIDELVEIIRLWIITEEERYPPEEGFKGRIMLLEEILKVFGMGERLDEILRGKKKPNGQIQLFLDEYETKKVIKLAQKKIENCAWVIQNADSWDLTEAEKVKRKENARESAEFWETLLDKIESQLSG